MSTWIGVALERGLGQLKGRWQITERADSTLQAERDRLVKDLARERERLQAAEEPSGRAGKRAATGPTALVPALVCLSLAPS